MLYNLKELLEKYLSKNSKYNFSDFALIAAEVLNISKEKILSQIDEINIDESKFLKLEASLKKLTDENIPIQYILGYKDFFHERYKVNENVLIPREDTEILVDKAIEYINKFHLKNLLDMCTGSGCIGISISKNSNIENLTLVDISQKAILVAKENAKLNDVIDKTEFVISDLFKNLDKNRKYDILVSNPPYIRTNIIDLLDPEVKKEPISALDGGKSGTLFYNRIFEELKDYLEDNAFILLEIGYDQNEEIKHIVKKYPYIEYTDTIKDLSNNDRVVICRFHQK